MFIKIGGLNNFTIFIGKHLGWSDFLIKLQGFPVGIAKFLGTAFL